MHPHLIIAVPVAHAGGPPAPHDLWGAWSLEPAVLLGLAVLVVAYALGVRGLWRAGPGAPSGRRVAAFAAGLAAVAVALVSPLDTLAEGLFAAHMAQHMLLVMVAAPLLVLGAPGLPLTIALPPGWRRRLIRLRRHAAMVGGRRLLTRPMVVWGVHVGVLWVWHLPTPYQAALARDLIHAAEHASFLFTGVLFWWVVLSRHGRRRLAAGFAVLYLFAAALQASALGALLTLAPAPLYPLQADGAAQWGLAPLADQQLAGLIMWIPSDLVYLGAAGTLFMGWLVSLERASPRQEAPDRPALPMAPGGGPWRSASRSPVADGVDQKGGA
jgi:putative membrane protein